MYKKDYWGLPNCNITSHSYYFLFRQRIPWWIVAMDTSASWQRILIFHRYQYFKTPRYSRLGKTWTYQYILIRNSDRHLHVLQQRWGGNVFRSPSLLHFIQYRVSQLTNTNINTQCIMPQYSAWRSYYSCPSNNWYVNLPPAIFFFFYTFQLPASKLVKKLIRGHCSNTSSFCLQILIPSLGSLTVSYLKQTHNL